MSVPVLIEDNNLSSAWCKVLQHILDNSGNEIVPLILTLTGFQEDKVAREQLNANLAKNDLDSIEIVSETIFPQSLYQFQETDSAKLFDIYLKNVLPRLKKIDKRNSSGTYFERLIAFGEAKKNQLSIIIESLKEDSKVKRRSKSQAAIFDPSKDHKNGVFQSFPCLQHVTFYKSETGGLVINSFYAMQYLYQRAYGNWLGLINLGKFVANETGLELERFNCFIGVEKLDKLTKGKAKVLLNKMKVDN